MDTQWRVTPPARSNRGRHKIRYTAILLPLLLVSAPEPSAQAVYSLERDGTLTQLRQKDATVSEGYFSQPVFYTLRNDGTLTGTNEPRSVSQQPGPRVVLATSAGRRLEVAGRIVNVREAPDLGAAIETQLRRGMQVISLEHEGQWVRVTRSGSEKALGWMYEPLLTEVFGYSTVTANTPLDRFSRTLEKLKEDDETQEHYRGLESPELAGRAAMSLVASEAWLEGRAEDRWETATHLGLAWRALTPAAEMAVLNIKDEQGRRQMTIIRP